MNIKANVIIILIIKGIIDFQILYCNNRAPN